MKHDFAALLAATTLLAAALAASARPGLAQETQVPVDTAGRVVEIDREMAERVGVFLDEYPDLQVARLFRSEDGQHVLELTLRRDGRILRQRVPLSDEEVESLRRRVSAAPAAAPADDGDSGARTMLVAGASVLGVGFYGWAVPVAFDLEGELALAAYMFSAAGSILVPYLYTDDRPVTYGITNAWWWGATRGISHGIELVSLIDEDPSAHAVAFGSLTGSLAEGIAGYVWAERTGMSAGTAHTIGNYGDLGQFWAGNVMMIAQPESERLVLAGLLAGSGAGIAAGNRIAKRRAFTWGDAEIMRAAAVVGAANGLALWDVASDDDSDDDLRILGGTLIAGSATGVLLADRALRGRDYSVGQAIIIDLAAVAGYAIGIGTAAILTGDEGGTSELFTILGAAGATGGLAAGIGSFGESAARRDRNRWDDSRLDLRMNPYALARLVAPGLPGPSAVGHHEVVLPVVSVQYSF